MPGAAVGPVVQLSAANQPPDAALPTARALLRFGVVADVQYADLDEGTNFLRTVTRYYRHAGEALQQAVRCWLAHGLLQDQEEPVAFVAQLGDLIDGLNAYQEPPQTAAASATVMRWLHPLHEVGIPVHHVRHTAAVPTAIWCREGVPGRLRMWSQVVGNHEVMNFTRAELHAAPLPAEATAAGGASFFSGGTPGEQRRAAAAAAEAAAAGASITARPELTFPCAVDDPGGEQGFRSYHSFVHPTLTTWRFIVLDAFAISTLGWADDHPNSIAAWALLAEHNPNDCRASGVNLLAGMEGVESRWMPYNGAYGEVQLRWLAEELAEAHEAGQRVVVLTHVGVQPGCCLDDNLAWDYAEVKSVLHSVGPGVRISHQIAAW